MMRCFYFLQRRIALTKFLIHGKMNPLLILYQIGKRRLYYREIVMKICLICDLHLPYHKEAIQYDVLRWAMEDLQKKHAQALVVAGDFTVHGDIPAAEAFLEATGKLEIPVVICTGNSEYRNHATKEYFRNLAAPSVNIIGDWKVIALHDGEGRLTEDDYTALEQADDHTIVALHHPYHSLPSVHRERLLAWRERRPDVPVFYGHLHYTKDNGNDHMLTAADPDKVAGEHPCIAYYDTDTKKIEKSYYFCPIPAGFMKYIGISCYRPETDIPYAAENRIGCIELRHEAANMERGTLLTLLQNWRQSGGTCLSLHAPELTDWDGNPVSAQRWDAFTDMALQLGADRITIHIPRIKLSVLQVKPWLLEQAADFAAGYIEKLPETCVIGMENMHTEKGETAEERRYGYIPEECMVFIRLLRERCRHTIGMHLDVGHARNNMPLVETYTLGPWYAEVGTETVGYHIHQVNQDRTGLHNHNPIPNFYGPMICFASFFRLWVQDKLNHVPVILEIRPTEEDPMPYRCTIDLLRREEERNVFDIHSHTHYSFCGKDDPQLLVNTAVENGIRLFGICDHNYGIGNRKREYIKVMRKLAEDNRNRIRLAAGIEIATIPTHYDIKDPAEIADYDYCLIEHITSPDSIVGKDLFGFCDTLGILCGIAHTDMFAYCDMYGYAYEDFFREMADRKIFWEMNVSYDSIHRYHEHGYVKEFRRDIRKQEIIRSAGVYISVGFDGHRREDYDGARVHAMYDFLKDGGFRLADELLTQIL